jgi:hypothetical protein
MIHYALRCANGHEFDGWFNNSASFDIQSKQGLLDCPVCAGTDIERALMAPNVRTRFAVAPAVEKPPAQATPASAPAPKAPVPTTAVSAPMPDQVRAVLQRIRAEVEKTCDYVGPRFAEAARGIATGAEPPRAIYGEATEEQEAELADDGIEVARIPWVPRANG